MKLKTRIKIILSFYVLMLMFCSVHYCYHKWLPIFLLLLGPVVGIILIKYIDKRINNRSKI